MSMCLLILGTGGRANAHAIEFGKIDGVEIVGAVDPVRAKAFAASTTSSTPSPLTKRRSHGASSTRQRMLLRTALSIRQPWLSLLLASTYYARSHAPKITSRLQELAAAAESAGLIAMVNFSFRDDAPLQRAREIVLSGRSAVSGSWMGLFCKSG